MIEQSLINFYFGEVIESTETYTRKAEGQDSNMLFTIDVIIKQNNNTKILHRVKPISANIKQIPIKGESVLIFQGYDHTSSWIRRRLQWYYFPTTGIQSRINSNVVPVNTENFVADKEFVERSTPILQPYIGDVIFEGRYGNSIRFSSTINTGKYDIPPTWSGPETTDPIIILSNSSKLDLDKNFVIEDIESDDSSLYLTSTQTLDRLQLSTPLTVNNANFKKSQFVGVGDRIILRAKKDIAIIDSEKGIVLNTTGEIKLGDDSATEPMVHGKVLEAIILKLMKAITAGGTASGAVVTTNALSIIGEIADLIPNLNSEQYKIKKT
jgi:hypothetical protein